MAPDLRRLDPAPARDVASRLEAVLRFDDDFDLVIVHRDAEGEGPERRRGEAVRAVASVREHLPALPVVPVRMTEAWLLVDEIAIRRVAGRPNGKDDLGLPRASAVEQVPDPKLVLRTALERASGARGRRLKQFKRDFASHRRRLLEGLDHNGPVSQLTAWRRMETAVVEVLGAL